MSWPSHGARGRHDWATYIERGYVEPFRDALREMPDADVAVDDGGRTMLMEVLPSAHGAPWLDIVALLIAAGADVNRREAGGRPVWDFAPTTGPACVEVWRALVQAGLDVGARDGKGGTPLLRVCGAYTADHSTVLSVAKLLMEAGAAADVADRYHDSPLLAAAGAGHAEVVRALLEAGARPDAPAHAGRGPLYAAAMQGHAAVVGILLRAGARVDAATAGSRIRSFPVFTSGYEEVEGVTPLTAAAEAGHLDVVRLLADAGADVNRADSSGFTPLMGAARAGHAKMVRFLLGRGARRDAVDSAGRTARAHAVNFQHQLEIAPILDGATGRTGRGRAGAG